MNVNQTYRVKPLQISAARAHGLALQKGQSGLQLWHAVNKHSLMSRLWLLLLTPQITSASFSAAYFCRMWHPAPFNPIMSLLYVRNLIYSHSDTYRIYGFPVPTRINVTLHEIFMANCIMILQGLWHSYMSIIRKFLTAMQ